MCGIAGIIARSPVNPGATKAMIDRMAHRGPDDEGFWRSNDERVALGHRRLSILDPSARGHQPMLDPLGNVALTFNGEIYNYVELANRLRSEGAEFSSGTDTEVLLQAYLYWGEDFVAELNGMFAFCLYDNRNRRIICARDRFGEKPFLFVAGDGFFAFASEYKALLALSEIPDDIDEERLFRFLQTGRLGMDEERETVFPAIQQLTGGEMLVLDIDEIKPRVAPYWTLRRDTAVSRMNEADAVTQFRDLLFDSVKLRMRSDVELGSCLSGGLDSSAIVCIARNIIGPEKRYHVFSGRFPGTPADEGQFADQVVAKTDATLHIAEPRPDDLLDNLGKFIWLNELPMGSTSQFAQWCVFEKAREQGVTVLLDGQGADELLGGYEQYFEFYLEALRCSGDSKLLAKEAAAIRSRYPLALSTADQKIKRSIPKSARRAAAILLGKGSDFSFGVSRSFDSQGSPGLRFQEPASDPLSRALEDDSFHAHLPALLRYGDRNSMAHSREVRLPFCDHRIAEFVLSLPPRYLMGGVQTKRILRQSMRGIVPETILTRWNKQGFLPPQDLWLSGRFGAAMTDLIHDRKFVERGWWNVHWWKSALKRFHRGETHLAWVLWKPFIAESWHREFVEPIRKKNKQSIFQGSA